jgi:tight adherence protein B
VILVLGALLAAGLLLTISPFVWPRRASVRARRDWMQPYRQRLTLAGLGGVSPTLVIVVSALLGVVGGALVLALIGVLALAVAAAILAGVAPSVVIGWRARARRRANRVIWPDVVDQLVSAVRSGLALPDSVVSLAHTGPALPRASFAVFESAYRATGNFALCLDDLKSALADPVADRIIETLRMSREVGGTELTTVLRNLSADLRQESAIRAEVEARQSWVMNAAKLGVAAPWVVLLLLATRPEAAAAYNSAAGTTLIVVGLAVSFVAYRVMLGLGRLPEERRWFA